MIDRCNVTTRSVRTSCFFFLSPLSFFLSQPTFKVWSLHLV
uniref:Uncharacterized protein n=1 Tax=Arundo donax TaxID=35708 RepID=A0A0A8XZW3_ARUDO